MKPIFYRKANELNHVKRYHSIHFVGEEVCTGRSQSCVGQWRSESITVMKPDWMLY